MMSKDKAKETTNIYKLGRGNYVKHEPSFVLDGVGFSIIKTAHRDWMHRCHIDLYHALKELECRGCNGDLKLLSIQYSARRGYFGYCQSCTDAFLEEAKKRCGEWY